MTPTLQEAITAARGGDVERAQLLAAEIVQASPDDANAWYLLSQLVDSDARRAAYLSKTLALDPAHEQAREEVAALPAEVAESLSVASLIIPPTSSSESVGEVPPDSFVTGAALPGAEMGLPEEPLVKDTFPAAEAEIAGAPADVPEWLQPANAEPAEAQVVVPPAMPEPAALPPAPVAPAPTRPELQAPPPPPPPPAKKSNQGNQALTILLVLLGLLTLAVLAFLVFLLLS